MGTVNGQPVVWEACQTFSGSWGYHRDEESWKSLDQLIQMLIDTVSKGGNLLLNVGPTGRGEFDARALDRLAGMGEWMRRHCRAIYGCTQAPDDIQTPQDCRLTYNPDTNRLYVHVFAWPYRHLHLDGMADRVAYAQLLNDASEVKQLAAHPGSRVWGDVRDPRRASAHPGTAGQEAQRHRARDRDVPEMTVAEALRRRPRGSRRPAWTRRAWTRSCCWSGC